MRVLIVGAGLAGLSTALGLTEKDDTIKVTIVECKSNFESRGATFGLAPNGQRALEKIAPTVLTKLKDVGVYMPSTGGYMLPWWTVRDALLEEVRKRNDRIELYLGVLIDEITLSKDSLLTATFQDSDLNLEVDCIIGADGVHSYVRSNILNLPPACPTNTFVWRGSINTNEYDTLTHFKYNRIFTIDAFGPIGIMSYFNFDETVSGALAWVFSCHNVPALPIPIQRGKTTPLDIIKAYIASVENPDKTLLKAYEDAKLILGHTHKSSDLTFSSEMAVVDLEHQDNLGWGGKGNITLIGDAAHSLRPASGLGGSLAFEDAALLTRLLRNKNEKSIDTNSSSMEDTLRAFETQRLPRLQSISRDQTIRSLLSYKVGFTNVPPWDPLYCDWVFAGPDASSDPPVDERDVFGSLLEELDL